MPSVSLPDSSPFVTGETAVAAAALSPADYRPLLAGAALPLAAEVLREALAEAVADDLGGSHALTWALLTHALARIDYAALAAFLVRDADTFPPPIS